MKGTIDVYSWQFGMGSYHNAETCIDVCVVYEDGQIIRTELTMEGYVKSHKDIYDTICKYFKGDLTWRADYLGGNIYR